MPGPLPPRAPTGHRKRQTDTNTREITGYDPIIPESGLPGPISLLKRNLPRTKQSITYHVIYELWSEAGSEQQTTLPTGHLTRENANVEAAVVIEQSRTWFGGVPVTMDNYKDTDGVQIFERGCEDGRFVRIWVERFHVTTLAVPERSNLPG